MSFAVRKEPPPPDPKPSTDDERFPGKIWLLALFVVSGLYFYLIFLAPTSLNGESSLFARVAMAAAGEAERHPVLLAILFLSILAPGLLFPLRARRYLLRLVLVLGLVWLSLFVATSQPVAWAASKIQDALSTTRPLPDTFSSSPSESDGELDS